MNDPKLRYLAFPNNHAFITAVLQTSRAFEVFVIITVVKPTYFNVSLAAVAAVRFAVYSTIVK